MDWDAKVRVFVALLFYHRRALDPCTIRALAPLLVPSVQHVIEVPQMIEPLNELFLELQSDICDAHERVARSWLLHMDGKELLQRQKEARLLS